jgi:succinate-semialdehyde dehydrogenase/glutarate-semialdehyde dehydrogenase
MVLKQAEQTPFSALALARLGEEAGLPPGVFKVVTGEPKSIDAVLTGSGTVRKLTFTGSTPVGAALMAQSANTVKRLSLELGGNAPVLIFDDADMRRAVGGALIAKFRNSGQSCVDANRICVQKGIYEQFARFFAARVGELRLGDGFDKDTDIGPLIDIRAVQKVQRHVNDAVARGARVITGGNVSTLGPTFFEPMVCFDTAELEGHAI